MENQKFKAESSQREKELKNLLSTYREVLNAVEMDGFEQDKKIAEFEAQINNLEGQIAAYQDCIEKTLRKD